MSLAPWYYITEHDHGEDDLQPYNFVLIGGTDLPPYIKETISAENTITEQFRWLWERNDTIERTIRNRIPLARQYKHVNQSRPQSTRLVIMSSTTLLTMTILNVPLPLKEVFSGTNPQP